MKVFVADGAGFIRTTVTSHIKTNTSQVVAR